MVSREEVELTISGTSAEAHGMEQDVLPQSKTRNIIFCVLSLSLVGALVWAIAVTVKLHDTDSDVASLPFQENSQMLKLIHFNDNYQIIAEQANVGEPAKLLSIVKKAQKSNPSRTLVTCGGDLISPSRLSSLFQGSKHAENHIFLPAIQHSHHTRASWMSG